MSPYHNKIKQRIKNGELISFEFVEDYPRIGNALVLHFNAAPFVRPVRPHRYSEYNRKKRKTPCFCGKTCGRCAK